MIYWEVTGFAKPPPAWPLVAYGLEAWVSTGGDDTVFVTGGGVTIGVGFETGGVVLVWLVLGSAPPTPPKCAGLGSSHAIQNIASGSFSHWSIGQIQLVPGI